MEGTTVRQSLGFACRVPYFYLHNGNEIILIVQ